MVADLRIME